MTELASLRGTVVIDEIQRRPELFEILRVLADRTPVKARFLILGSASPDLIGRSSETLAGRVETIPLSGFTIAEVGTVVGDRHWLRGGFPRSFLARTESDSVAWRKNFIGTFLERDVPGFGIGIPPEALRRFWTMLAHYHGGIWNAAEFARAMGVSEPTVRRYLDVLSGVFVVRQLQPWHENIGKRQVKSPKVYVRDSGILHVLLGIGSRAELLSHPKCGASFEGWVIEQSIELLRPDAAHFWATHNGAEIDLLILKNGRRFGIEVKRSDAPTMTPSMQIAVKDLGLEHLVVIYPGETNYRLSDKVSVTPVAVLGSDDPTALIPRYPKR